MATQLILKNADKLNDVNLGNFITVPIPNYGRNAQKSFFLHRELVHTKESAKRLGIYRHCKPYKGHFLDYIVGKEFATLEDWVEECGYASMDDVMFGFNKFDGNHTYITLNQLIDHLDPMPPMILNQDPEMVELTKFVTKLHVDELSLTSLMVRTHTYGLLTYTEYMEE
uniref:Uncharacterized protein n=1 Tax=viral metagenome TaxID=1070528 RepID=A0A6C0F4E4_9ZZZZ